MKTFRARVDAMLGPACAQSLFSSTGNGTSVSSRSVIISDQLKAWRGVDESNDGRGDFTQAEAAAHLGVPSGTYIDWEQGRHGPRGLALDTVLQRIKTKPSGARSHPASAKLPSNRKESRSRAQSPAPAATGARAKRVTHAKNDTAKKSAARRELDRKMHARWKARRQRKP